MFEGAARLQALMRERILVLEGPKGTMIQKLGLEEVDYRGARFADHPVPLRNNNEVLNLTRPDLIEGIHYAFARAGADILATNTFNGNRLSQADFGTGHLVAEMNASAVAIVRRAARRIESETGRRVFIAGTMGPTPRTASLSPDVARPGYRNVTFDELAEAYSDQAEALIAAGVDSLILETSFDTLNVKAALYALFHLSDRLGDQVPLIVSVTFSDKSERTLSGQTPEAFWTSVNHYPLLGIGVNCGLGAAELAGPVLELDRVAWVPTVCYPNAGLPNALGQYDQTPEEMARFLGEYAEQGWLNIVGGCCGSTPEHIEAIAEAARRGRPRSLDRRRPSPYPCFAGLDVLEVRPDSNFILIGERTNVSGSRRFARLIRSGDYEAALSVARQQVENGANILDVNMDEGLLDARTAMVEFLRVLASDPEVSRVPIMIDSSDWEVLRAGLKCVQGKSIVNSLSLKDGEEAFRSRVREARRLGAAIVVMAFDEEGQAETVERKVAICTRAYRILVDDLGVSPQDIIFDPNVLAIGTGIPEHASYGAAFIEAVRQIKRLCPGALTSGGISNLSFAFRGNDLVRETLHSVFLYHAIHAGLDMGIVNAGQLAVYEETDPVLRELAEDLILNRREDATERLLEYASKTRRTKRESEAGPTIAGTLEERIASSLIQGRTDTIEGEMAEALTVYGTPLAVIEGPLMAAMREIGDRFADGRMFLPQVVKSARTMKQAVAFLTPHMEPATANVTSAAAKGSAKIVLATVKGDVHDIGKNIVGVVLGCGGHAVRDLGVMVPAETILDTAIEWGADIIGLSGLITPSLEEMAHVAREMERHGMQVPLLIGGATTSRMHTAVKIAPEYRGAVIHVQDASRVTEVVRHLMDDGSRGEYIDTVRKDQAALREQFSARQERRRLLTLSEARSRAPRTVWTPEEATPAPGAGVRKPVRPGIRVLRKYIDWSPFLHVWDVKGRYPAALDDPETGPVVRELLRDAEALLDEMEESSGVEPCGIYGLWPARSSGDDLELLSDGHVVARFPMLRQQQDKGPGTANYCLADWVAPISTGLDDSVGLFVVTAGNTIHDMAAASRDRGNDYRAIMLEALADRLAEAFAEWLHQQVRIECGYARGESGEVEDLIRERYRGIRPAPGYPACPDHSEKAMLFDLLDAPSAVGVELTSTMAMSPPSSICGFYVHHRESVYFPITLIGRDQLEDYARRRGMPPEEIARWIGPILDADAQAIVNG